MNTLKNLLSVVLCAAAVGVLTGCPNNDSSAPEKGAAVPAETRKLPVDNERG
jgi:hypothetical protein